MGLETVTYIDDLNTANPIPGDARSQGDDHIRNIKTGLKNTLPNGTRPWYFPRALAKTADFVVAVTDLEKIFPCNTTADHIDITLPTLIAANDAWACKFVKTDATANTVRIAGTINGDVDGYTLTQQYECVVLLWTGTEWIAFPHIVMVNGVPTFTSGAFTTLTVSGLFTLSSTSHMILPRGTTAQRPGGTLAGSSRFNSTVDAPEFQDAGGNWRILSAGGLGGAFKNLLIVNNSGTPNSQVDINADWVLAETSSGVVYRLAAVDLTVNCAVNGANGLDAGGLANSTWYYRFVIYNPTTNTVAGLVSASAAAPTLPAGYTAFALLPGSHRTNGSAQFHRITTKGDRSQYIVSASVTTVLPNIVNGTGPGSIYSVTAPVYVPISISSVVPPTARVIHVIATNQYNNLSTGALMVAPNGNYSGPGSTNPPPVSMHTTVYMVSSASMVLESASIYWVGDTVGAGLNCLGWDD